MKVKIIGNGVWGKAVFSVISKNNSSVSFAKKAEEISDQEVVILCIPTQFIREALKYVSFSGKNKIIINTAKGIEKETHHLPNEIVNSVFGEKINYYSLMGPSFAEEVSRKMPTLVNLGCKRKSPENEKVRELFQTDYFRVRLTKSVDVLEISGAFKNVYAIACGIAQGLGFETNTRVKLMVLAIEELNLLYKGLNLKFDSSITAGTIGDLILTCNSSESRNFTFGKLITKYSVEDAMDKIQSTVEGFHSLSSVDYFKKKTHAKLPLASFVQEVVGLNNPKKVKRVFEKFVSFA